MSRREQAVLDMFFLFSFCFGKTQLTYFIDWNPYLPSLVYGEGEPFNPMINGKSIYFTTFFFFFLIMMCL
jgi:hypothetical protein